MRFPHRTQRNFYFALLFCCTGLLAFGLTRLSWQAGAAPQGNLNGQSLGQTLPDGIWQGSGTTRAKNVTGQMRAFRLNPAALTAVLNRAPMEFRARLSASQTLLTLPLPDGSLERFRIEESPIMEPSLAAQLPLVKTYRGQGLDDPTATVRFDWTPQGLHALILSANGSFLVEPETPGDPLNYLAHTTQTLDGVALMQCGVTEADVAAAMARGVYRAAGQPLAPAFSNGATLRTYRLAVAASGEYVSNYGGGTVGGTQTAITSVVNLIDAIYEREMAVRFTLVNNTNIIFTNAGTDPYSSGASGNTADNATLTANQTTLDNGALLGSANYDIGHLFGGITGLPPGSASFSGLAQLGVVCVGGSKGRGVSTMGGLTATLGIFINGIAHEIGHQFAAPHTFNGTLNNCGGGNRNSSSAYESGSGSTIMSYAGTCGSDNIVNSTDVRFHSKSFEVMLNFMNTTATCNTSSATGNTPPTVNAGADFTIPKNTPFTLTATASDPDVADAANLTYTWEQIDSGGASFSQNGTEASYNDAADPVGTTTRPIFRPFAPTTSLSRTFPSLTYILSNANDPPQLNGGLETAEELPRIGRTLNFRFTARDNRATGGGVTDDSLVLTVDNSAGPFAVTAPNTAVAWTGNTTQAVTWNVNSTNLAPVSTANVKISLSTDGGNTFPTTILASTANDGTENITVPNVNTTQARIKVEAVGNIFFDISNTNFTITPGGGDGVAPTASVTANNVTTAGGTTYQFTVTYSDNVAINVATLNTGDVNVSGPGGFNQAATFVSVDNNTNGTPRTATYSITPPGGAWDVGDNGTYTVTMNASQVADTSANNVVAGALGTFMVNIAGDMTAPTASLTAANVTTAGATSYQFTITYSDNVAINVATLNTGDVNVSGPGGFNQAATFVSVNNNTNGTPRTATYQITPPGGAWDLADNGTYTVAMNAGQVADTNGNNVAAGALGTFMVNIGCITSVTVNNTGDGADINPGNGVCETGAGNGICTLRAAIQEANALTACAPFTINFSVNGTINLGAELPALDHPNLTINGPGANLLTVQRNAAANFRIFLVNATRTVVFNGLTITGGDVIGGGGGAVLNNGTLTITNCQITGNTATGFGGGINNNNGTLTVTGSTIANNTTSASNTSGGIDNTGPLTLVNTTFSGNTVTGNTGNNGGGLWTNTQTTITNCTFTNNAAAGANSAGGLLRAGNTTTLRNTIIAANQNNTTVPDVIADGNTGITSNGFNLIGNVGALGGIFNQTGDQTGTGANPLNPLISVLQNNGGPTSTHALLPGSPAINAGTNTGAPATDQRGIARPQQTTTDIGAFESRGFTLAVVSGSPQSTTVNTAFANPLVASVTSANGEPVNGGRVTFTPPGAGASATLTGNPATIAGGQASVNATANATAGGPYNVAANATGVAAAVNFMLTNNAAGDTTAPTASVTANEVTTPGATSYQFTITYSDNVAINVATLSNGDANVSGPGGFNQAATFVSVNINTNGTPRTATYQITPPGGGWVPQTFNGTYTVTMNAGQVADTNGNFVAAGALGTFNVVIGCVTSVTVNNVTDAADATPGNGVCETAAGNNVCTLRAAIQEANALPNCAPFTINFSVNGIFNLGTALPNLDHPNLTINGPGANLATVRRNAASLFRVFTNNAGRTATLVGLTVSNGDLGSGDDGGGVWNSGTMTITNCAITGNHANGAGGVSNDGTLTMTGSTLSGNSANFDGGGLYNLGNATATLTNCTISGNTGSSSGFMNVADNGQTATLTLTNCTVTANSGGSVFGSFNFGGATAVTTQLRNTLVAGNTGPNFAIPGGTTLTSLGNNLDSDGTSGFVNGVGGNIVGTAGNPINALLGALANNGGPTSTHALLPGSPAINTGTNTSAPATDQRGIARPQQTITDIGAFESRGFTLAVVSGSGQATTVNAAFANPLVVSVSSANAEPVNGGRVTFTPPGAGASASLMTNPATITGGQASVMAVANATAGGPYNVTANATGAAAAVNFALTNNAADGIAPTATLSAANVTTGGGTTYTFTITYSDNVAINVGTLGNGDVNVSGPGGFNAAATFVSVNTNTNGTPRTATYSITPPGGAWDVADNGTYTVTMNASQVADTTGNFVAAGTLGTFTVTINPANNGLQFYPLAAPVRLLDTRPGASPNACSQPNAPIAGQTSRTQPGRNICTIPANAQALTGNVTTVDSGGGFLTLYPSDAQQPTVASTNYGVNEIINNVFTVGLGADGAFKIFANNTTDVVVDVTGYYAPPGMGGLYFHPLPAPVRLLETRAGQPVGCVLPGAPLTGNAESTQQAISTCTGIPAAARAIVGNATTVGPQGGGFLTIFPADAVRPLVAASNFNTGQVVNGPFSVGLAANGQFKIYTTSTTDLVVDVLGYYSPEANDANGTGLLFNPLPHPVRLLETRPGLPVGCFKPGVPLTGGTETLQTARGVCDGVTIPANALGVVGNATVVFPSGTGFLTLWPSTAARPTVATSNYNAGDVGNRHFIVGLGQADGAFKIYTHATSHLVIDLSGYFAP